MAITDSLVSYYKLDETSGNRADSHGSNTLSVSGSPTYRAGKISNAVDIPSTANRLQIAGPAPFAGTAGTSWTAACWVYLDNLPAAQSYPMSRWMGGGGVGDWCTHIGSDGAGKCTVESGATDTAAATPSSTIAAGAWYYLVGWFDHTVGTYGTVYVQVNDGTVYSTALAAAKALDVNNGFCIGHLGVAFGTFDGAVDCAAFWSRVLTSGERTALYGGGSGLEYPFSTSGPRLLFAEQMRVMSE